MAFNGSTPGTDGSPKATTPCPARISAARLAIIEACRTKAELLQYFCGHYWGFDVVACEYTSSGGIFAVSRSEPELVLAGLPPMDMSVVSFVTSLRGAAPAAKLVLLTSSCNEYLVYTLGFTEYHGLVWDAEEGLASLGRLIERVRHGGHAVSMGILNCQHALRSEPNAFPKLLSRRHLEVLVCIAHSMSDEEIARQLGCSVGTALSHRQRIMQKLGIHNTPKLIQYCIEKGFASFPLPMQTPALP